MPEIKWLGHASFLLRSDGGVTLVMDPYDDTIGYPLPYPTADIVTTSHDHRDHGYVAGVRGNPQVIRTPGEHRLKGIRILGIPTHHDERGGKQRGPNVIYVVDMDGVTICHLGDLGHPLKKEQVGQIGAVDVLMVPVGGVYTIDARQAAELVRQVGPRLVLPMHYQTPALSFPLAPVDDFFRALGLKKPAPLPGLTVRRETLPAEMQVVLLDYR